MLAARAQRLTWRVSAAAICAAVLAAVGGCALARSYDQGPAPGGFSGLDRARAAMQPPELSLLAAVPDDMRSVPMDRRVVIYNAGFRVVVADIAAALESMERIAEELGGYVQQIDGDQITIRVPVARYHEAVDRVEALGQVVHRKLEALDVTEEYVDLEARLKNMIAVRQRLLALLEKAEDVKTALDVEKELKRVGEEIEQLQAKLELINNRVAHSTITASFERVAQQTSFRGLVQLPFAWLDELDPNRLWQER